MKFRDHRLITESVMVWLVVWKIYVALAVFQPYRNLEAGDNQSLKYKWRGPLEFIETVLYCMR